VLGLHGALTDTSANPVSRDPASPHIACPANVPGPVEFGEDGMTIEVGETINIDDGASVTVKSGPTAITTTCRSKASSSFTKA